MKKIVLLSLILLPISSHAEWLYVAEATQGSGIGDITYVSSEYYTDHNKAKDYRTFKILVKKKSPIINSKRDKRLGLKGDIYRSSVAHIAVYCNQPNRIFMGITEYY